MQRDLFWSAILIFVLFIVILANTQQEDMQAIQTMGKATIEEYPEHEVETKFSLPTSNEVVIDEQKPESIYPVFTYSKDWSAFEEFEATAYCACPKCCGKWADGITASGTKVTAKRTIAVDSNLIPLGSKVEIEGLGTYIAEDTGSTIKGKIIDIYFDTHEEALKFGRQKVNIRILSSTNGGN